jgi:hypothetical protein
MSTGRSQHKERMAKYPSDLLESCYNGPEELENNWIVIDNELKLHDEEESHEQPGNEAETDPLISKKKRGKSDGKKSEKLRKYPQGQLNSHTNFKDMAAGWIQKAVGSMSANGVERL